MTSIKWIINSIIRSTTGFEIKKVKKKPQITKKVENTSELIAAYTSDLIKLLHTNNEKIKLRSTDFNDVISVPILSNKPIRAARISAFGHEALGVHSFILIDDKSSTAVNHESVRIRASSYDRSCFQSLIKGNFLHSNSNDVTSIGVLTKSEMNPWIVLELAKPKKIKHIELVTRQDDMSHTLANLMIEIQTKEGDWKVLNTAGLNLTLQIKKLEEKYNLPLSESIQDIRNFILSLHPELDRRSAMASYLRMTGKNKKILRDAVNTSTLNARELEWTVHGVGKSFRFWNKDEKRDYLKLTSEIVSDLKTLSPDVCLGFGSALSVERDKDFIPHDDDMDIIIAFKDNKAYTIREALSYVKTYLESKGYIVRGSFFNHWHVVKNGYKVDVFVGIYDENTSIGWYPGPRKGLERKDLFPVRKVKMFGIDCDMPRETVKYLSVVYGEKWHSPEPDWSHDWSVSRYLDIH